MKLKLFVVSLIFLGSLSIPKKAEAVAPFEFTYRQFSATEGLYQIYIFSWYGLDGKHRVLSIRYLNGLPDTPPWEYSGPLEKRILEEDVNPEQFVKILDNHLATDYASSYEIKIYNINGELLFESKDINKLNLNLNDIKERFLLIQFKTQNFINIQKIIK